MRHQEAYGLFPHIPAPPAPVGRAWEDKRRQGGGLKTGAHKAPGRSLWAHQAKGTNIETMFRLHAPMWVYLDTSYLVKHAFGEGFVCDRRGCCHWACS